MGYTLKHCVFLFDIDGTILSTQGAGRTAMNQAIRDHYHVEDGLSSISFAGATDRGIVQAFLEAHPGVEHDDFEVDFYKWQPCYVRHLSELLTKNQNTIIHPGIIEFVAKLKRTDAAMGLLTGNVPLGAFLKLESAGLIETFFPGFYSPEHIHRPVDNKSADLAEYAAAENELLACNKYNVFGSMHADRNRLPGLVPVTKDQVLIIIGDTERDIECAQVGGHISIGVRTGHGDHAAMLEMNPDFMFDDLSGDAFISIAEFLETKLEKSGS